MCIAKDIVEQMANAMNLAEKENERLTKALSNCDLGIQDVLHKIELEKFNVVEGYYLAKKIKEICEERRKVKDELGPLRILLCRVNESKILNIKNKIVGVEKQNEQRIYTPRILDFGEIVKAN